MTKTPTPTGHRGGDAGAGAQPSSVGLRGLPGAVGLLRRRGRALLAPALPLRRLPRPLGAELLQPGRCAAPLRAQRWRQAHTRLIFARLPLQRHPASSPTAGTSAARRAAPSPRRPAAGPAGPTPPRPSPRCCERGFGRIVASCRRSSVRFAANLRRDPVSLFLKRRCDELGAARAGLRALPRRPAARRRPAGPRRCSHPVACALHH